MPRYIIRAQFGSTTVSLAIRDVERGETFSATFSGPRELLERFIKRIESLEDVEVEYE